MLSNFALLITPILATDFVLEKEFATVTCGSIIKLAHKPSGYYLHSHEVNYGSGSGQQSVTGFQGANDPNSYFAVFGEYQSYCTRGVSVQCGSTIRLKHSNTKKFLHSHKIQSPLSQQQEVSAYDVADTGDNWIVECKGKVWKREEPVSLKHVDTGAYLSSNTRYTYGNPINGQLEVSGRYSKGENELWIAREGIYISIDYE
ncbi:Stromal cell-derived factor 2-like protein 1 [Boothiomyces macroporosus]|uniref:Stromal cell-derived factor 2-like protein 1 n=1 Tax=Boothiomyces macroporosus TaxID=261099 RepID=A0AAD5ULR2_9FUNG|nr:Stromal cell-derived factor 2-like protein 1 [Boothiomyces macroporosus]